MGIDASIPSCPIPPTNQKAPGLMVPVVSHALFRQLLSRTSTVGTMFLNGAQSPTSRTKEVRYGRLYCTVKPTCMVSSGPCCRGKLGAAYPVMASGRRASSEAGRSPSPLPKNSCGVSVDWVEAPTTGLPIPPMSQSSPHEMRVSWRALTKRCPWCGGQSSESRWFRWIQRRADQSPG